MAPPTTSEDRPPSTTDDGDPSTQVNPDSILTTMTIGSLYLILGYLVSLVIGLATKSILSRTIGGFAFGQFSIVISLATTGYILTMLALDTGVLRFIPANIKDHPEKVARTIYTVILTILCITSLLTIFIVINNQIVSELFLQSSLYSSIIIIGALLIPSYAFTAIIYAIFQGFQDMRTVMRLTIIQAFLLGTATLVTLFAGLGVYGGLLSVIIANIIPGVIGFGILSRKLLKPLKSKKPSLPRSLIKLSLLVYVLHFFGVISSQSGTLLLGFFGLTVNAGIFAICWMFSEIVFNLIGQIGSRSFFPLASRLIKTNSPQIEETFNRVTRYTLFAVLAFYIPLLLVPEILLPLFGPSFIEGVLTWRILGIAFLCRNLAQPPETILIIEERRIFELCLHAGGAILLIVANLVLIPMLGLLGAAVGTLIWGVAITLGIWIYFLKTHKYRITFLSPRLDDTDRTIIKGILKKIFPRLN